MLPNGVISESDNSDFLPPRNKITGKLECWELGGVAISNTSQPFQYFWYGFVKGNAIYIQREGHEPIAVLAFFGKVTEMSFTFDQNMRTTIAYVEDNIAKFYWYDSLTSQNVITEYPNIKNPKLSLDDKRNFNVANSDIIFAYISDNNKLCYRLQRERYGAEHVLLVDDTKTELKPLELFDIGMSTENRFLFDTN